MTAAPKATLRALLLTTALVAGLAACNRDREPEAPAPAAPGAPAVVTPADAAAPLSFETKTPYADVRLTLPDAIRPSTPVSTPRRSACYASSPKAPRAS